MHTIIESLAGAQDTLFELVERCPFGIYVVDESFRIVAANRGSEEGAFRNVRPLIGRPFEEAVRILWPEDAVVGILGHFRRTLVTGEPFHSKDFVERRNDSGAIEGYEWTLQRIALPGGGAGVVCYYFDATRLRATEAVLHESERRFRTMADSTPVMIWVTDARGEIEMVNRAYCEFFGVTEAEVKPPWSWQPLVHSEDQARYTQAFLHSVAAQAPYFAEARVRHADGSWRWVASFATPRFAPGGVFLGHVGSSPDISELKRAQEALREADRHKDDFIATLAHELRNPLAPLGNALAILERSPHDAAAAERARAVMRRQLGQIARLVDDLLDIGRIKQDKLALRTAPTLLAEVLDDAVAACRPQIQAAEQVFTAELPANAVQVMGDGARLCQVFSNLLNNASKFTPPGGRIGLSAAVVGDEVRVAVRDTGRGIPGDKRDAIFEPFAQLDSGPGREHGGLGIGLTVVRRLVEMHGGRVEVHSEGAGRGAEFVVRLPVLGASFDPESAGAAPAAVPLIAPSVSGAGDPPA